MPTRALSKPLEGDSRRQWEASEPKSNKCYNKSAAERQQSELGGKGEGRRPWIFCQEGDSVSISCMEEWCRTRRGTTEGHANTHTHACAQIHAPTLTPQK